LTIGVDIWRKQNKPAVAYQFAKRVTEIDPSKSLGWSNLAMMADNLYRFDEAEACFQRAASTAKRDEEKSNIWTNWACMLINKGEYQEAEKMSRKALAEGTSPKRCLNLGLSLLAQRKYREGWQMYDAVVGFDQSRKRQQYKDEPVWDGSHGKRIVVYGEQGLGDEIAFASMIPDAVAVSKQVIVDCTDRLAGLFRRSFPQAIVHGTRVADAVEWEPGEIDGSITVGGLGKFFRSSSESFPSQPYLVADPDRVEMWRGLFAKQGKPVYGIAWTGGVPWTADRFRKLTLEQLVPLFRSRDAVWVSLQYKDASKEIAALRAQHPDIDLRQYAFGTLTQDYDDTAAMVEALDCVVGVPTSVIHLAAGLGKSCIAMKAPLSCWKFAGEDMLRYPGMRLIPHGNDWPATIAQAARVLHEL
jgi:tetratricopeptide (TPR) repeat protein